MVDLRSGMKSRKGASSSSSSPKKSSSSPPKKPIFKSLRSRVVNYSVPRPRRLKWVSRDQTQPPPLEITEAFNYLNKISVSKYQLVKGCSVTPVLLFNCILFHVNFTAKSTHVADAPEEMFFAELRNPEGTLFVSPRLCVSLGSIGSISGDKLNGCCYCREYNNVWHPKGGGFVRGHDEFYKTVQDIWDENHMPMHKKSCHVDNASLYATEVIKSYNQTNNTNYELVKPGSATCVNLTEECSLLHVNFKAKKTDPDAPMRLFFAELTTTNGVYSVKCCMWLDPPDIKSGNLTGDKTNGCYYCHDFNKVRHPDSGGFVRGGDSLYKLEKELLCSEEAQPT
ncbi:hypothetical protein POM88_035576 [Heracleum sosnowskyi]|uniref:DUF3615 domain-containing protein n=1 Tax=Heracleum sosnowskyi TaxID=360622 RepID=A0AAD8ME81_9APIA|nr:hypothetical protein POM88_035576 [Heracleum sosnowskyi]